jgi:hypothetical protein
MTEWNSCLEWQEKRQYDRITTNLEAQVRNRTLEFTNRDLDPGQENPELGLCSQIVDLSFVGSRLSGDRLLGLTGHCLELTLLVPDGELFALLGHVVRLSQIQQGGYNIGLRFFQVSVQDQLRLTRTLHALDCSMRLQSRPLSPFSSAKKKTVSETNYR